MVRTMVTQQGKEGTNQIFQNYDNFITVLILLYCDRWYQLCRNPKQS